MALEIFKKNFKGKITETHRIVGKAPVGAEGAGKGKIIIEKVHKSQKPGKVIQMTAEQSRKFTEKAIGRGRVSISKGGGGGFGVSLTAGTGRGAGKRKPGGR